MQEALHTLTTAEPFIPHGYCYLWKPALVWLHLASDALIAIAYYSIPITLLYFVRKRQDLPFNWIFLLFGSFIVACGTTHVMDVWTLWYPTYWVSGILKAVTMLISVWTAILLVPLVPKALALPSPAQLALANQALAEQMVQRQQAEEALRESNGALESRVQERMAALTRSEAQLRQVNENLELRVVDRTAELTQTNDRLQHELMERQRAEAKLQEITTLQQAILDSANFTIISTDTNGIITSFNTRAETLLGYAATEMIGQATPAIIHDRAEVAFRAQTLSQELGTFIEPGFEVFVAKAKRGKVEERQWSYLRKDGSRFPILLSATALRDPIGNLTGFLGIGSDITARKAAEAALKESEERFRGAFDYAAIGMALVGLEGQWLKVNRSLCEMIGYSELELLQTDFQTITHPDDLETDLGYVQQLLKGEISFYQMEKRYFHKQGHVVWILLSASLTRDDQDRPLYFIPQIQDISDRKAAEAALRESEERLQLSLEGSGDGLWDWNIATGDVYYSPRWMEMLGYEPDELPGDLSTWARLMHPEDKTWVSEILEAHLKDGSVPYHFDYRVLTKAGEWKRIADYGKVVVRDRAGKPLRMSGTHKDISDHKQAKADLRTLATQLEQSNQELQNFAFVASHDLKEPLRTIRNFSNLLQSRCGKQLNDQGKDYVNRMQNAAHRMQTLIDDLLLLSRISTQAEPFVSVDLNPIVETVLSGLEVKIQETNAAIDIEPLPTLEADPTQIHQLLQNLISNALKFHGDKPPVVKIRSQVLMLPSAKQNLLTKQMYQISIQDQGIGFDEQYRDRIFKIFERLHGRSEYEGTGIGLAVCRRIVERHNGSIVAQSAPGKGSTFTITLPIKQFVQAAKDI
ncbi:MAG: PAS domain S-box protein [Lyngbya sp. HA4199-MV5]|jgi:PAS domain S-box-containing protein|nr:PAS domain S-box protein [Lyngbya sp. HA4199-MV5]